LALSLLTFFNQYGHPIAEPIAARSFVLRPSGFSLALGISSILIQSALLMGTIVLLARRWSLPFGALTLLIALNAALMSIFHDTYYLAPAALAGGLLADVMLRWLKPAPERPGQLRMFAFAVPAVFYRMCCIALSRRPCITSRQVTQVNIGGASLDGQHPLHCSPYGRIVWLPVPHISSP
jgi:hypothetical protein